MLGQETLEDYRRMLPSERLSLALRASGKAIHILRPENLAWPQLASLHSVGGPLFRGFMFNRVRLFIDDQLGLPIHFDAYDWPASPQAPAEIREEYTYSDLRLNVGLSDLDFDASNGNYAFGRF